MDQEKIKKAVNAAAKVFIHENLTTKEMQQALYELHILVQDKEKRDALKQKSAG